MSYIILSQKTLSMDTAFAALPSWLRQCCPTWHLLKYLDKRMCAKAQEHRVDSTEIEMEERGKPLVNIQTRSNALGLHCISGNSPEEETDTHTLRQ